MSTPIDLTGLKERQKVAWASGDYAVIGTTLQIVGENLAEACDLHCDEEVLDVAAGNGNATLAAARRGCQVTSTDYVAALLERGQDRARAEHLDVIFQVADAEALPFADESYDAVLSTFGVMFAPDQATAAAELARVCRRGGRIGLANWTPEGFVGQMFKVLGRHVPPPPWPSRRRTGALKRGCTATSMSANFCCRSPAAPSTSAIARRRISSTFSATGTGRYTRPLRHCRRKAGRRWRVIWRIC